MITSIEGKKMLGHMPSIYDSSRFIGVLFEAEGSEFDRLSGTLNDILNQFFVSTATWGLALWEEELGIPIDRNKPLEERRSVVKSKLLGYGKVDAKLIERIAESYQNGEVSVQIGPDRHPIIVRFIDSRGIPSNLNDLEAAIEEVLPAHLRVAFEFTYANFGELDTSGMTFGDLEASGMTFEDLAVWSPNP